MITNRDAGLIRLAGKKGFLDPERARALIEGLGSDGNAESLLAEAGLTAEQIDTLRQAQKSASIPAEFDGYSIQGVIGKGGMSVVLKALHGESQAVLAIKVLSPTIDELPTSRERFHREIRSVAKLAHPNIIRCFGSGETNNRPYLALEYMGKGDLLSMIRKSGSAVPEGQAMRIIKDIASALTATCAADMIHRDIKPENIFLAADGTAKLADLGLSKSADDEMGLTMVGKSVGTPAYMSPEQAQGRHDVNIRTDLFSLGSTLYHMLSGRPPFEGGNPQDIMRKVVAQEPTDIRSVVSGLLPGTVAILQGMMAKRPDDRYQDPQHLLDDLLRLGREGRDFDPASVTTGAAQRSGGKATLRRATTEIPTERKTGQIIGGTRRHQKRGLFQRLFGWMWGR